MVVLLPARIKKIKSKIKELEWSQGFPHYNPMGAICCHGNQSSNLIWPKTLCSQSPTPMMLQMKFDYDQPAGLRDIHVWKCGRTDGRRDRRRLESHSISSPWAFGSGELKTLQNSVFIIFIFFFYIFSTFVLSLITKLTTEEITM